MTRLLALLLLVLVVAGCASQRATPDVDGARLLVTIHYDAADGLQGNLSDRYRRPGGYGAGPGAEPLLDALAADYGIVRAGGSPLRTLNVHCEVFATARGA